MSTAAIELHAEISTHMWDEPEGSVAKMVLQTVDAGGYIDLLNFSFRNFSRLYCDYLIIVSSGLWENFQLDDFSELIHKGSPRPKPAWAMDTGSYCDIMFVARALKLNAFRIANYSSVVDSDLRNIVGFGILNCELILPKYPTSDEGADTDEPDEYAELVDQRLEKVRMRILQDHPNLDISGWRESQLINSARMVIASRETTERASRKEND